MRDGAVQRGVGDRILSDPIEAAAKPWTVIVRDEDGFMTHIRTPTLQLWRIRRNWLRRLLLVLTCVPMSAFWIAWPVLWNGALLAALAVVFPIKIVLDALWLMGRVLVAMVRQARAVPQAFMTTWRGERADDEVAA